MFTTRRARLVSAAAFAAAAVLFGVAGIGLATAFGYGWADRIDATLLGPFALVLPVAFVGWVAGPRLGRAPDGLAAAAVGVGVTILSALLSVVVVWVGLFAMEVLGGNEAMVRDMPNVAVAFLVGVAYALLAGLVASPFGSLGGYAAWRQICRAASGRT